METPNANSHSPEISAVERTSTDLVKLIRKLRWIGMEKEAQRLQVALSRFPSEERPTVLGLQSTD